MVVVWLTHHVDLLAELGTHMRGLAQVRPVFHSEADFQLAFAWHLQLQDPRASVRLETRPRPGVHLDLLLTTAERPIAIELKYLTASWTGEAGGEQFHLLAQGAQDIRAYDCVKDIERVEQFVASAPGASGLVLVLANDAAYWRPASHARLTNADAFRLREGSTIAGSRAWGPKTGPGTMRGRERSINLTGEYTCRWNDYSSIGGKNGTFRYLAFAVDPPQPSG